ncbi:hypothetical protein IscW_ISCW007623 [Ixodes scapularis]|uniref:Aftiphilin clathrin-binding box domain-containing protein n=1 Tax=Ixodes scapularis TaxID=6945 RepID=B7PRH1_IXOSC|nr:hypothetical protein IscW_ISCW007623 [Ixodes scapularis]|eukprot:XP_002399653.1 hypothetical protein IscW_ISCW007623 [Ixodes scapularis]
MSHPEAPAGPDSHATEARDDGASWDNLEFEADWQQAACGNDDDDFTDFAQATSSELPADDGFADFAAFESAPKEEEEDESWTAFEATTEVTLGHLGGYQEQSSPEQLLRLAYPGGETGESEVDLDPTSLHTKLWLILQDLDQATSLQYQWSSSGCCQHLLHSLNIDSRNIPPLLSGDAQRLLDSLPDLTFMQAAVLMFPVRLDS